MSKPNQPEAQSEPTTPVVDETTTGVTTEQATDTVVIEPPKAQPRPNATRVDAKDTTTTKPTGFSSIQKKLADKAKTPAVVFSKDEMAQLIKNELQVDVYDNNTSRAIQDVFHDMYTYAIEMAPTAPVEHKRGAQLQTTFVRRLCTALDQEPAIGVVCLQIIQMFFSHYQAFKGELPFRYFNTMTPNMQKLSDIVYALQMITDSKKEFVRTISTDKLKASCPNAGGQIVLLQYITTLG